MAETPFHPKCCGPCDDCREALADYATIPEYMERLDAEPEQLRAERAYWKLYYPPIDPAALEKHVRRFGDGGCYANSSALRGEPAQRLW